MVRLAESIETVRYDNSLGQAPLTHLHENEMFPVRHPVVSLVVRYRKYVNCMPHRGPQFLSPRLCSLCELSSVVARADEGIR